METAYRWDGSAWQYLSQKGKYVFAGFYGISPYNYLFNRSANTLTQHSGIMTFACSPLYSKFSPDGVYLFVGCIGSPYFYAFKRTGDTFTQITFTVHYGFGVSDIEFSHNGNYMAMSYNGYPYCDIYKKQADGSWVYLSTPFNNFTSYCCAWSPDDNYLAIGCAYNYITILKRTGDTFAYLTTINGGGAISSACYKYKMEYDTTGNFIVCTSSYTPYLHLLYKTSESTFNIITPNSQPAQSYAQTNVKFFNGNCFITGGTNGFLYLYSYNSSSSTYLGAINVGTTIYSLDINSNGTYMVVGGSNFMYLYSISGTTFTLVNTIAINSAGYGCTLLN